MRDGAGYETALGCLVLFCGLSSAVYCLSLSPAGSSERRDERSGEGFVNLSCRAALYLNKKVFAAEKYE